MPSHIFSCCLLLLAAAASAAVDAATVPRDSFVKKEVCYGDLGCFRSDGNFVHIRYRPITVLPQSPEVVNPKFALFTRSNSVNRQFLVYNDRNKLVNSNFDGNRQTKVIVFGFTERPDLDWIKKLTKALLLYGNYNVIVVDWTGGNGLPYSQAVANARITGAILGRMLQWLSSQTSSSLSKFHLLGHSLGSHVSGYAGEFLRGRVGRITGLDPAGPYFEFLHREVRLDETDARFVDVIHTDGNNTLSILTQKSGFGLMQPLGHVDFYPNGGRTQPNCDLSDEVAAAAAANGDDADADASRVVINWCHHQRVNLLMVATVEFPFRGFTAVPCDSYESYKAGKCKCGDIGCASMGLNADKWNRGGRKNVKMFLDTTGRSPFEIRQ